MWEDEEGLRLWRRGRGEGWGGGKAKGTLKVGQEAEFSILHREWFRVGDSESADNSSLLTVVGGRMVHSDGDFEGLAAPLPPAMPDWSPVNTFGGYHVGGTATGLAAAHRHHHGAACSTHGAHGHAAQHATPTDDLTAFWGAMGCSCFAF